MSDEAPRLVPLRVRLPYASEDEFVEKYGSNVAKGGVFIATRAIKPEGTPLSFEFVLQDGTPLLRGEGAVVKAQVDEGGSRSGMTVRFTRLDARSKALVDRILAHRSGVSESPPPPAPDASAEWSAAPAPPPSRASPPSASRTPAVGKAPEPPAASRTPAISKPTEPPARTPSVSKPADPRNGNQGTTPPSPMPPQATPSRGTPPIDRNSRITGEFAPYQKPAPSADQEVVLGIDLGTTNSRAAIFADGTPKLVPIGSSRVHGIPSVVSKDNKQRFVVGTRAKSQILVDPKNTVFGAKRLMGRRARG
ncbi:MAG: TIGR02266 family protein, partial [Myxococcaceae bacterium]